LQKSAQLNVRHVADTGGNMISARVFILIAMIIRQVYQMLLQYLSDVQRKKPLPEVVADIYDADRYQKYLEYTADTKRLRNKYKLIDLAVECLLIFSPLYRCIEITTGGNPYGVFFLTYGIIWTIGIITEACASYEVTFDILEKYEINKKTKKEFVKDFALEQGFSLVLMIAIMVIAIFVGEHMVIWTNNFSIGYFRSIQICAVVGVVFLVFFCVAKLLSYFVLRKQYTFTPMDEGELKDKINKLQEESKKKVKEIYIYNESKKSTTKNAFLLKLFWHREFGIADNFMNENAERELLAVLSHEVGHLKHRKDIRNFVSYGINAILVVMAVILVANPEICLKINAWVRDSFNISSGNYYLYFVVYSYFVTPIMFLIGIFSSYKSKYEEYEADQEAVRNGYGEDLIKTFKALSSDELVNVDPHPFVEFMEYSHPGMYRRITAIKNADSN